MSKAILVIGAAGDVGQGIAAVGAQHGWRVAAAGRNRTALDRVAARHAGMIALPGSVETPADAAALMDGAQQALGGLDAVIVSVNAPASFRPLFENDETQLVDLFRSNIITHFNAAKAALDALPAHGVLLGMGGGMADWVPRHGTHQSIVQAGLHNLYRGIAKEYPERLIRQMQIVSMVNGEKKRGEAKPEWLTDMECGTHACAIVENPAGFPGPIIILKAREQVGQPDA